MTDALVALAALFVRLHAMISWLDTFRHLTLSYSAHTALDLPPFMFACHCNHYWEVHILFGAEPASFDKSFVLTKVHGAAGTRLYALLFPLRHHEHLWLFRW